MDFRFLSFFLFLFILISCESNTVESINKITIQLEDSITDLTSDTIYSQKKDNLKPLTTEIDSFKNEHVKKVQQKITSRKKSGFINATMKKKHKQSDIVDNYRIDSSLLQKTLEYQNFENDSNWIALYSASENSFLIGWENELKNNPSSLNRISKSLLLNIFEKRLESIFFDSPRFIEYSLLKIKESKNFLSFLMKWNLSID